MDVFWWRVMLSFAVGGTWLMFVSVAAEEFGTKLAALLGGLPSTILISLFFIGLNEGPEFAARAVIVTPVVLVIDAFFMLLLAIWTKNSYFRALVLSGAVWFGAVWLTVLFKLKSYPLSLALWAAGLIILLRVADKVMPTRRFKVSPATFTHWQLFARAVFAGSIIALAVLISRYAGPTVGGIFSAFPAVYLSNFTILYFARGLGFAQAAIKPLLVSGSINVVIYGLAVYFSYPKVGIYTGTLLSFIISLFSSFYVVRPVLNRLTADGGQDLL